jgi:hypothetical protein
MTLDHIVVFDTTVAFVIPLVALLMSSLVMCHKETFGIFVYYKEYTPFQSFCRKKRWLLYFEVKSDSFNVF